MSYEDEAHLDAIFGPGLRPLCIAKSENHPNGVECTCPIVQTRKGGTAPKRDGDRPKQGAPKYDEVAEHYAANGITHARFPSLSRLFKDMVITEKIDGSNAAIGITEDGVAYAQSRTKLIAPGPADLAGFAEFVQANQAQLAEQLGPGLHFGEWWGAKIQRTYGRADRKFSLFNTGRWDSPFNQARADNETGAGLTRACIQCPILDVVPLLLVWGFDTETVRNALYWLLEHGSLAEPGFMEPEGLVVYHTASKTTFKYTPDDRHKGER